MAKVTHAQEVSTGTSDSYTEHELSDPHAPDQIRVTRAVIGGESESVGDNSKQSSASEESESDSQRQPRREPAQTTDSHSPQPETETGSDANLMGGNGLSKTAKQFAKKAPPRKAAKQARTRTTDEFDDFE